MDEYLTTVYVVRWANGVTKVGRTINPRRVRKLELRGGRVDRLIHRTHHSTEAKLAKILHRLGPASFSSWQESVPYLGAGGTGFSECRTLTEDAYSAFLEEVDSIG